MDVSVGARWERFVEEQVRAGHYGFPDDVVREGLQLVAEREACLHELREAIGTAIERSGRNSPDDLHRVLDATEAELRRQVG